MPFHPVEYLAKRLNKLIKAPRRRRALAEFDAVPVSPGDLAIDCGANVGEVAARLVARGCRVVAFEPNPIAFSELKARFAGEPRVECIPEGVAAATGTRRLYLNRRLDRDPLGHSAGSSMLAEKRNLDPDRSLEIRVRDLAEFILGLDQRVRILKIDVEGAEIEVLNHLIDRRALDQVDRVFCETHEYKAPGLARATRKLRRRLKREGLVQVNLDWC